MTMTNVSHDTDSPLFWTLDDHTDEPFCELMRSLWIDPVNRGFAAGFARYGVLGGGIRGAVIDGWMYSGFVPLTDPAAFGERIGYVEQNDVLAELSASANAWLERLPRMEQERRALGDELDELSDPELAVRIETIAGGFRGLLEERFGGIPISTLVGEFALAAAEAGIDPAAAFAAMPSVPASARTAYRLDALAATIDEHRPELAARLRDGEPVDLAEVLAVEGSSDILDAERDLPMANTPSAPTLGERAELLVDLLRGRFAKRTQARQQVGALPASLAAVAEGAWLSQTWREETGGLLVRWVGLVRRACLEAGGRLMAAGRLEQTEDVIHLSPEEIARGLRDDVDLRLLAAERASARAEAAASRPAPIIGEPPAGPPPGLDQLPPRAARHMQRVMWFSMRLGPEGGPPTITNDGVEGVAAATGVHEAKARIVRGPEDFGSVEPGDVIVCATTSPVWNAVLATAGAVVSDGGGFVSHTALIARELGIPAVVGTKVATAVIPDGAVVRVDGSAGTVTMVSR